MNKVMTTKFMTPTCVRQATEDDTLLYIKRMMFDNVKRSGQWTAAEADSLLTVVRNQTKVIADIHKEMDEHLDDAKDKMNVTKEQLDVIFPKYTEEGTFRHDLVTAYQSGSKDDELRLGVLELPTTAKLTIDKAKLEINRMVDIRVTALKRAEAIQTAIASSQALASFKRKTNAAESSPEETMPKPDEHKNHSEYLVACTKVTLKQWEDAMETSRVRYRTDDELSTTPTNTFDPPLVKEKARDAVITGLTALQELTFEEDDDDDLAESTSSRMVDYVLGPSGQELALKARLSLRGITDKLVEAMVEHLKANIHPALQALEDEKIAKAAKATAEEKKASQAILDAKKKKREEVKKKALLAKLLQQAKKEAKAATRTWFSDADMPLPVLTEKQLLDL
jgi:hypothetical protein